MQVGGVSTMGNNGLVRRSKLAWIIKREEGEDG